MSSEVLKLIGALANRLDKKGSNFSDCPTSDKKRSRKIQILNKFEETLTQPPPVKNGVTRNIVKSERKKRKNEAKIVHFPLKKAKDQSSDGFQVKSYASSTKNEALLKNLKASSDKSIQIKHADRLRIIQLNIQNFARKKIPHAKELIKLHSPDILMINEFGVEKDAPVFPRIESYEAVAFELKTRFSGVVIYVQKSLIDLVKLIKVQHSMTYTQICGIQIQNLKIFTIYRSPNHFSNLEVDAFSDWIRTLDDTGVLLMGDFNIHVEWDQYTSTKSSHQQIAEALLEKDFIQYQGNPTHFKSKKPLTFGNTLDLTLCNSLNTVTTCTTDPAFTGPWDHIPVLVDLNLQVERLEEKTIRLRKKRDVEKFVEIVEKKMPILEEKFLGEDGIFREDEETLNRMNADLTKVLLEAEKETVPEITIDPTEFKPSHHETMSKRTSDLLAKKRNLYKYGQVGRAQKLQKQIDESLAKDRDKWSQNYINKLAKDPNAVWDVVKKSTISASSTGGLQRPDGTLTFDNEEKVTLLSNQYSSVLTEKTEPTCDIENLASCETTPGLSDIAFTEHETIQVLKNCNNSMAVDNCDLYMPLIRDAASQVAVFFTCLMNLAIRMGSLAIVWLISMVIPIPKGGDLSIPKQWRPITLVHTFLRVIEGAFNWKICKYLDLKGFFHRKQFGFRRKRSTIHNLIEFWTYVVTLISTYTVVEVIYADTSAAFDRLSHGVLLDLLFHKCGIFGMAWRFVKAWFTGRRQFVKFNGSRSETVDVTSSCMQGSCMGTTLWNIYLNDILFMIDDWIDELNIEGCAFWVYADDIKIVYPALPENIPKINELLKRLQTVMTERKLKFNAAKCHVLSLGGNTDFIGDVYMSDEEGQQIKLSKTKVERDLGVMIEGDGSFSTHIKKSLSVAKATVKILRKIFYKCDFGNKVKLYHAYVFSRMSYGSEIWRPTDRVTLDKFNRVYVEFFKFTVIPPGSNPPYVPEQILIEKDLLLMFDIFHDRSPLSRTEFFGEHLSQNEDNRTRADQENLLRGDIEDRFTKTLLVVKNKNIWNSIPNRIREVNDRDSFQQYVREEILEKLPCNTIRDDFRSGEMRERAIRHAKILERSNKIKNINIQAGTPLGTTPDDFLLNEDFEDDFLKPNLCLKLIKKPNLKRLKKLSKIAPWMNLCKCDRTDCMAERENYIAVHGPLEDQPRVVIVDDKVIIKNKFLLTTIKKVEDFESDDDDVIND